MFDFLLPSLLAHSLSTLFYPHSPRGPEVLARLPPAQERESRYSLQPFLLFFPQIKVPLNDFPNMLGFFIGELGEVQLPAHLAEADPVTRYAERQLSRTLGCCWRRGKSSAPPPRLPI